ncbi:hypothetical protein [Cryobacterium roopkundense]|uniref:hypothetical protein n=1 Tax=Cryobacterium roopkundense TaxID=1001240 RepID=UPI00160CD8A6|nr:hypothetical protein [Cryobacterium roopkundense]
MAMGAAAIFMVAMVILIITLIVGNGFLQSDTLAANTFWVAWFCTMMLFPAGLGWTQIVGTREVGAGYTTLGAFEYVERRDPHTGRVLRAGGAAIPPGTFTLKHARAYAAAHPVIPAIDELPVLQRTREETASPRVSSLLRAPKVAFSPWRRGIVVIGALLLPYVLYLAISAAAGVLLQLLWMVMMGALPLVIMFATMSSIVRSQIAAVHDLYPSALLVPGMSSDELRSTARAMHLSPLPIRTLILWAIDESGVGLWQGGATPVRAFHLTWADIAEVATTTVPNPNSRPRSAITFNVDGSSGRTYRLPFHVSGWLDAFPEFEHVNITTVADINRRFFTTAPR